MTYECFADEIAIDFPSASSVAERMRDRFLGEAPESMAQPEVVSVDVSVSRIEAARGVAIPVDVPVRSLCSRCGGRGETWAEPCSACDGTGASFRRHTVRVPLPAGIADQTRFRFRFSDADGGSVRVEARVTISK